MLQTIIQRLGSFAAETAFDTLPFEVIDEVKRLLLDSIGCAIAAQSSDRGRIGVEFGMLMGARSEEATILGSQQRTSAFGAAFANAELINALDFDAVLPPGHVVPFVLPGALALAEREHRSGRELIVAVAVAHEVSYRIGKAMDYVRDMSEGRMTHPPVFGYSSSVFGAAAANARLLRQPGRMAAFTLGIAGSSAPVNAMWSSSHRIHAATTNYALTGNLVLTALTAAHLAASGHTGDLEILDDREFGFPRFIGTTRWEPGAITAELGSAWRFPREQAYKIYPHCRVPAALLDAMSELVAVNDIAPEEIESIEAWGEPQGLYPVWANTEILSPTDALNSTAYGLAVSAHRIFPTRRWQDDEVIFDPSIQALVSRVRLHSHPGYTDALAADPSSRLSKLEVTARGESFVAERRFPRGARTSDPSTEISTDELIAKFKDNTGPTLSDHDAEQLTRGIHALEDVDDVADLINSARPS
ncbi:MmgE/PrpD family protein [Sinomonas sp. G460-2]|uniref:MmgE/PrpD family protein n=1 Tax=Sinomonas sp. G460-2 TaxID=3393464 RepID=UPI0039F11E1F